MSRCIAAAFAAFLALTGCSFGADRSDDPYRPPALVRAPGPADGRDLYLRDCAWCHGPVGRGTERGPDLVSGTNGPALVDFVLSTGRMPIADADARMQPGVSQYTRSEIEAIVDYSRELGAPGPDVPELAHEDSDLAHGNELYLENCAACHSTTGVGGALTQASGGGSSSVIAPPVLDSTPTEVAEAIRVGPGTMPVFGEESFDQDDLDAIVAYVVYLQDPVDRGGADAGRVGPVAEGAIGWIIGLGSLLLCMRWIGTKRGEL